MARQGRGYSRDIQMSLRRCSQRVNAIYLARRGQSLANRASPIMDTRRTDRPPPSQMDAGMTRLLFLDAALARIPFGAAHAVRLSFVGVTIEEIRQLHGSGLVGSTRVGFHSPEDIRKDPAKAFWYRTVAGDKALTEALGGGINE